MGTFKIIVSIIFLSIIIVIILVAVIYIIVNASVEKEKKKKATYLARFSQNNEKHKIVFLGDSLTDFYPLDEFFHGFDLFNRGIAGDTTDNVLDRLDTNVYPLVPRKVFLQIGTNDLGERKSPEYVFENIKKIISNLQTNVPNVSISIISLYPVNPKAFFISKIFVGPRKNKDLMKINQYLQEYCEKNNLDFIDVYPHLLDKNGYLEKKYTIEGLHITYEGYLVITKLIIPHLSKENL